jgi:hypothetical protein
VPADAVVYVFDYRRYRAEVVPALVRYLRASPTDLSVTSWYGLVADAD